MDDSTNNASDSTEFEENSDNTAEDLQNETKTDNQQEGESICTDGVEERSEEDETRVEVLEKTVKKQKEQIDHQREEIEALKSEKKQLVEALSKQKAEFDDYKTRANIREEQAKSDALQKVVSDLTSVRDTLVRTLEQESQSNLRDGVESTLSILDSTLNRHGIEIIDPKPGTSVDPHRHEVIFQDTSDEYETGKILSVHSAGYCYEDNVLDSAQVVVVKDT